MLVTNTFRACRFASPIGVPARMASDTSVGTFVAIGDDTLHTQAVEQSMLQSLRVAQERFGGFRDVSAAHR